MLQFTLYDNSLSLGHFLGEPGLAGTRMSAFWILPRLRIMEVASGDNWSYKTCKAPGQARPDVLPVAKPTVSEQ